MNEKSGLYFHIPFCKNKCPYCDFYSVKYNAANAKSYTERLVQEIKKYRGAFDTVYFGGGTPSLLEPHLINKLLTAAREQFDVAADAEITVECNPREALDEVFRLYRKYGVNRISLGMQSAVDSERFALGRTAGREEIKRAVFAARAAGIENVSLDLMLGIPHQTPASLEESLCFIDTLQVQHVSAYMLKIEKGTPFFERQSRLALPDEDTVAEMYLKTVAALDALGLKQYEISNFSRCGFESRHNLKYWRLVSYLGLGKSAHSFWDGKRFYYDRNFNLVPDGEGGTAEERVMLGLRLNEGIEKGLLNRSCQSFISAGLMKETGDRVSLTPQGMLVSNTIIGALL